MKTRASGIFTIGAGWLIVLMASFLPGTAHAVITGSDHDMRGTGTNTGNNQICIYCHTPHNADATQSANAPLWNHEVDTSTVYTVYNTLLNSPPWGNDQVPTSPTRVSKLCLSCHDGTVAIDSYGNMAGAVNMTGTPGTPGSKNLGINLSDDHPISVQWVHQTVIGDNGAYCTGCHFGGDPGVEFFGSVGSMTVECASCHDVHNNTTYAKLLHMPVDDPDGAGPIPGSALCLRCHEFSDLVPVL